MPSPRRRAKAYVGALTSGQRRTLLEGGPIIDLRGRAPWWRKTSDNEWVPARRGMRQAWLEHRDELLAEAAERDLVPWAAREFEGMAGRIRPHEQLAPDEPPEDPRQRTRGAA